MRLHLIHIAWANYKYFPVFSNIFSKSRHSNMTFSDFKAHSEPLFKKLDILKFNDNIILQNCLFVYEYLKGKLPSSFDKTFCRVIEFHSTGTKSAKTGMLFIPRYKGTSYGLKSIYKNCINSWNLLTTEINRLKKTKLQNKYTDIDLSTMFSKNTLKKTITQHFLSSYKCNT